MKREAGLDIIEKEIGYTPEHIAAAVGVSVEDVETIIKKNGGCL